MDDLFIALIGSSISVEYETFTGCRVSTDYSTTLRWNECKARKVTRVSNLSMVRFAMKDGGNTSFDLHLGKSDLQRRAGTDCAACQVGR